jgi:hypothetical protein
VGDLEGTLTDRSTRRPTRKSTRVWTDGYSNLFQVWK